MTKETSALRMAWAPHGGAGGAWWGPGAGPSVCDTVSFGPGVAVSRRDGAVEATWHGDGWQSALEAPYLAVRATSQELRITVPPVWRASVYFTWRDARALVSSDLRALAAALPEAEPSPEGVALFLAGGNTAPGVTPALYRGILRLAPGHRLVVRGDGQWRCERSWEPEQDGEFDALPFAAAAGRLQDHLDGLADRILRRHERVACLFSGGLDSSLVAATLLRRDPRRVVLFNVGSALGTAAEGALRARFLGELRTVSHPVQLPPQAGLVRSLRATNAVAPLPGGSPFSHVFEEIVHAARRHGCEAVVTGDGGDEIFAEREGVLVDLLARRSRSLPSAAAFFALRNGERSARTLRRAAGRLRALDGAGPPQSEAELCDILLADGLARLAASARTEAEQWAGQQWRAGWTNSGLESYRRALSVPEWEPAAADEPGFPVESPLADAQVLADALALRREELVPEAYWGQRKWLLRHAALRWLSPEIAMHPKIGSADGQILQAMRTRELGDLLDLLGSPTARRVGVQLPAEAQAPDWPLWHGDGWIRTAALVAWFEQAPTPAAARPVLTVSPEAQPAAVPELAPWQPPRRPAGWRTAVLAALNVLAQCAPEPLARRRALSRSAPPNPDSPAQSGSGLAGELVDLARRACTAPFVSGSPRAMSQALAWYLRLCGKRATLVRGTAEGKPQRRYWIEVDGFAADVGAAETPLLADRPRGGVYHHPCSSGPEMPVGRESSAASGPVESKPGGPPRARPRGD